MILREYSYDGIELHCLHNALSVLAAVQAKMLETKLLELWKYTVTFFFSIRIVFSVFSVFDCFFFGFFFCNSKVAQLSPMLCIFFGSWKELYEE